MKLTFANKWIAVAAASVFSVSVFAQDQKAATLEELLNLVKQDKLVESREHKQRESDFRQQKNRQAQLLKEAEAIKVAEEKRSVTLEAKYDEQEIAVQDKREQLSERLGSLKELFGHLTSTAGDLRSSIDASIVSAQYPGRSEFLDDLIDKMNSETKLPTIEEIEQLWYELQRETIEGGKIVKFPAEVVSPEGEQNTQEVVRIGTFNLISDGKYLDYTDSKKIAELTRQPKGKFLSGASSLQASTDGFTKTGIDPTGPSGGSYLAALINSPDLVERWHQGREVGYIITAVGVFGFLLGIYRLIVLTGVGAKVSAQLKSEQANTNNPLGRVLKVAEDSANMDTESLELKMEEAVLKEKPSIEAGLNIIKIISAVAPLLGLLGTVTGMILTFQAITIFGAGDPQAMAGGISGALVTTVLGLVVAIPMVLMHTIVNGRAKRILHILEEQSAGIVAENAERS